MPALPARWWSSSWTGSWSRPTRSSRGGGAPTGPTCPSSGPGSSCAPRCGAGPRRRWSARPARRWSASCSRWTRCSGCARPRACCGSAASTGAPRWGPPAGRAGPGAGPLGPAGSPRGRGGAGPPRREAGQVARRIRAARFPAGATLESFDFGYNPKLPAAQIRDLARLEFIAAGEGVIAYGPVGTGKSHLAAALGHQACPRGHDVAFTTSSQLLAELAAGHADRSFTPRVRKLAKITVLITDDSAMREFTPPQPDDLY